MDPSGPITHLLYLHGFRSSPRSAKAQQTLAWLAQHHPQVQAWCPQLPPSPREAIAMVEGTVAAWPAGTMGIVGSSLGGFYATVLAERIGCRAVLLNPAVHPARDLAAHLGLQQSWHGDELFFFKPEFVEELRALEPTVLARPERYFAVIAKGDEVLDWREMHARYRQCHLQLLEGGDHALHDYAERHLAAAMEFFGLRATR